MALIVADMPRFSIENGDDLDAFIHLYRGYLNTVGINPNADGGPPTGRDRAMGVLRSCLQGSAAEWFDENIVGKNWKLKYFLTTGGANLVALRALVVPEGAGGPNANTYVDPSPAREFSRVAGNALVTVGASMIPNNDMFGGDVEWERSGAEPSGDAVNATNARNNQPIVFQGIRPHQAVSYMRRRLPSIINEKRQLELHRLFQGNDPIRTYWKRVQRAGKLLGLPQSTIDDHFYKGLSADNSDDVDRLDPEYSVPKVVEILEKLENRRRERIDYPKKSKQEARFGIRNVIPAEVPPVVTQQEPAEIRKVAPQAIAQEQIDRIVGTHLERVTKEFQNQIQNLQNTITQTRQKVPPPVPPKNPEQIHRFYEGNAPNPFDDNREYSFEEIMGADYKAPPKVIKIAQRVAKKLAQAEERRQDRELARAMQDLNIDDRYPEPMDTSNLVRIGDSEVDADDLNVYIANLIRSQKKR